MEGCFRKDLYLGLVKRYILGAVEEVINTWIHSGGKYDLVAMADPLVDLFIRGIGRYESPAHGLHAIAKIISKENYHGSTHIRQKRC
jgi:hypothetical protein